MRLAPRNLTASRASGIRTKQVVDGKEQRTTFVVQEVREGWVREKEEGEEGAWKAWREHAELSSSWSSCWARCLSLRFLFLSPSRISPFPASSSPPSPAASLASRSESTGQATVSTPPLWISRSSPSSGRSLRSVSPFFASYGVFLPSLSECSICLSSCAPCYALLFLSSCSFVFDAQVRTSCAGSRASAMALTWASRSYQGLQARRSCQPKLVSTTPLIPETEFRLLLQQLWRESTVWGFPCCWYRQLYLLWFTSWWPTSQDVKPAANLLSSWQMLNRLVPQISVFSASSETIPFSFFQMHSTKVTTVCVYRFQSAKSVETHTQDTFLCSGSWTWTVVVSWEESMTVTRMCLLGCLLINRASLWTVKDLFCITKSLKEVFTIAKLMTLPWLQEFMQPETWFHFQQHGTHWVEPLQLPPHFMFHCWAIPYLSLLFLWTSMNGQQLCSNQPAKSPLDCLSAWISYPKGILSWQSSNHCMTRTQEWCCSMDLGVAYFLGVMLWVL